MSFHLSLMTVSNLLVLVSCWFCQIHVKPNFSSSSFIFYAQLSILLFPYCHSQYCFSGSGMSIRTNRFQYFAVVRISFPLLLCLCNSISVIPFSPNLCDPSVFLQNWPWTLSVSFYVSSSPHSSRPHIILVSHKISYMFSSARTSMPNMYA
jgi:hypothetical protein